MPIIEINQANLYYEVTGDGVPLIFIHPPLLGGSNFYYQQLELGEQFKVITFDIRGHGRSSSGEKTLTFPLIIEDIVELMNALQIEKAYIAGYSTGGSIAMKAMYTHHKRFCGGIFISAMIKPMNLYQKSFIQLATVLSNEITLFLLAANICSGNADCKSTFKRLYDDAMKGNPMKIREYFRQSFIFDFTDNLSSIKQPTLLVFGDKDKNFRKDMQLLSKKLPDHKLKMIENATHQLPTKAAKELNTAIANFIHHHA